MSALELAALLSPIATVAVAFIGRARLQAVETRVDGHLDGLYEELGRLRVQLVEARLSPAEAPPLDPDLPG